jgi:sugar phosphate isomerase/epimerase
MFKTSMAISPSATQFGPLLFAADWQLALQTARELGYDAVEVSFRDPPHDELERLSDAIENAGLAVSAVATGQSYIHDGLCLTNLDPLAQENLRDRIFGFIDFAAPWQAVLIIGGVRGMLAPEQNIQKKQTQTATETIQVYAKYAEKVGVRLAIEPINRYETNFLNTIQQTLQFIEGISTENLYVLPDTFHMNIEEVSMPKALELAGEKIGYVHFADSNRLAPGQGHIDFHELAHVLHKIGYDGYISAEILPIPDSRTAAELAIMSFHSL